MAIVTRDKLRPRLRKNRRVEIVLEFRGTIGFAVNGFGGSAQRGIPMTDGFLKPIGRRLTERQGKWRWHRDTGFDPRIPFSKDFPGFAIPVKRQLEQPLGVLWIHDRQIIFFCVASG